MLERCGVCVCVSSSVPKSDSQNGMEVPQNSRGTGADLPIQSNEAMAFRWKSGLINHLYLLSSYC